DGLRSRKSAKGYGSALPTHRAQASGSFSADGSPAPAPQAKCTKRADPDPKILPACKPPPPIRDRKTESANSRYGEGFFSKLLDVITLLGGAARLSAIGRNHGSFFAAKLRRGSTRTCSAAWSRCARWQCVCVPSPSTGSGHRKCDNAIGRGRRCTDATRSFSGRLSDQAF